MARRKTQAERQQEHLVFLDLVGDQKPPLEIMETLNITRVQLKAHLLRAYEDETLRTGDWSPTYELIKFRSLHELIRKMLSKQSGHCDPDGLVKVEMKEGALNLSQYAPLNPSQPNEADCQGAEEETSVLESGSTGKIDA